MRFLAAVLSMVLAAGMAAVPPQTQPAGKASPSSKKTAAKKTTPPKKTSSKKKKRVPKPPPVTAAQREAASNAVQEQMGGAVELGIQNAGAMVPFYEMLYRLESGQNEGGPVRVLQFGDSHTASDDWAGELRLRFQQRFGDGGPGFTPAGRPFAGFRRHDSKAAMSKGWKSEGLLSREGDGLYGMGGVSVEAAKADQTITLEAEGEVLEVFYLRQPGGGAFTLEDYGLVVESVTTDGEAGPAYYRKELPPGPHRLVLRTQDEGPVRVFGWVLEKRHGMTWETLGVNGAQADLLLLQQPGLLKSHLARRNPALVVLAYGTNEARRSDWTAESYEQALAQVIGMIREAAPAASVLIVGAPDQMLMARRRVTPHEGVDRIIVAQREAALRHGCGYWNLRSAMGGRGSMKQWVQAGLAQGDYVHFTTQGYHLLGDALYELLAGQYGVFQSVRKQLIGTSENGPQTKDH